MTIGIERLRDEDMGSFPSAARSRTPRRTDAGADILIAGDSALITALLRDALAVDGHRVSSVDDGRRALAMVTGSTPPDLLLSDLDLPGVAGLDLCLAVRDAGHRLPIIVITSGADQLVTALDAGADDFVRKPFAPAELSARVRAALRGARLADQLEMERDRSAALISSIQDGLMVFDRSGRIIDANGRACRITGLPRSRLLGAEPPYPFWPSERAAGYADDLRLALDRRHGGETDRTYVAADGSPLDVIVSVAPVRYAGASEATFVATIKDVTARRAAERALAESEARHRSLADEHARLHRVAAAVATCDDPADVFGLVAAEVAALLEADAGGVTRFDASSAVLVGSWAVDDQLRLAVGARLPLHGGSATARVRRDGRVVRVEDYAESSDGWRWGSEISHRSSIAAPVRIAGGIWGTVGAVSRRAGGFPSSAEGRLEEFATLVGFAVAGADARAELARQARTDVLTGALNRRGFDECLGIAVDGARADAPLALVALDIDHFKTVNDRFGHDAGDRVLRELVLRVGVHSRAGDHLARIGGEEFCLILPGVGADDATRQAERIRTAVAETPFAGVGTCTLSAGVAHWHAGDDGESLLRRADRRLYRAKAAGRNRVVWDDRA